jgi:hypothetical protein
LESQHANSYSPVRRGFALDILIVPSQTPLEKIFLMGACPPAVVFAGIDNELGGDAAAAESLIKLFGILYGDVPILFTASEQSGGRDVLNMIEG